jgi:hypothetical protein
MIVSLGDHGVLHLLIPNTLNNLPGKFLRIQITYSDRNMPPTGAVPSVTEISSAYGAGVRLGAAHQPAAGQRWEDWALYPNPQSEYVDIDVPKQIAIDQLVVDTICTIPEPSSIMLLGISAVAILPRRRKATLSRDVSAERRRRYTP